MIRRFTTAPRRNAMVTGSPHNSAVTNAMRPFLSLYGLSTSLLMMLCCVCCGASWANNILNVKRFGRWRWRNQIDDPAMAVDFRYARYLGGLIGAVFYWFWVGPRKYWTSDLELVPGNKRFGPF
ncbi:membrane-associated protein, putative [Bodo saltans]|uniref:Membrane-associated protein, putative n=1 Tax=Bodo saltans TaxID=75058 RepID=A0A0S4JA04_BODSA|nr:membrane-associated protein, putative [Bodo saltans]|eukprot:CUG85612.1 membrane-associated protein, putative [Bodo saltans]